MKRHTRSPGACGLVRYGALSHEWATATRGKIEAALGAAVHATTARGDGAVPQCAAKSWDPIVHEGHNLPGCSEESLELLGIMRPVATVVHELLRLQHEPGELGQRGRVMALGCLRQKAESGHPDGDGCAVRLPFVNGIAVVTHRLQLDGLYHAQPLAAALHNHQVVALCVDLDEGDVSAHPSEHGAEGIRPHTANLEDVPAPSAVAAPCRRVEQRRAARLAAHIECALLALGGRRSHSNRQHDPAVVVLTQRLEAVLHELRSLSPADGPRVLIDERLRRHEEPALEQRQYVDVKRIAIGAADLEQQRRSVERDCGQSATNHIGHVKRNHKRLQRLGRISPAPGVHCGVRNVGRLIIPEVPELSRVAGAVQ
eukprot:2673398-Prymnesium_polylepis.2